MSRPLAAALAALAVLALAPATAVAQTSGVSLEASETRVPFGTSVILSGSIGLAAPGQQVEVRDGAGAVLTTVTDASGGYSVEVTPAATSTYQALWADAASAPVTVEVQAVLDVRSSPARLFGTVTVRGTVEPARPGEVVLVRLIRRGRVVGSSRVTQRADGAFSARLRVMEPGRYRVDATFASSDLARGHAVSEPSTTPLPRLREGATGTFVRLLEARLVELRYRLAGARDGAYDRRTADAVVAFHKVQRMDRAFVVDAATWRALADPVVPRARSAGMALHFEVDQTRQVLYTVERGEITNILHVSTGAGGATRDGSYRVYRKLAGYSPNRLFYPSYFDGLRALHGWTEVPTYAASHGCVRIPYWNAIWVYRLASYGTRVLIYH